MNAKQITVTYILTEEQTERLEKITKAWNAANEASNTPSTPEGLFEFMMELGSLHTINQKWTSSRNTQTEWQKWKNSLHSIRPPPDAVIFFAAA